MTQAARFLMSFGPMLFPMALLTLVVLVLTVLGTGRLLHDRADQKVRSGIDAILFWGVLTALLGFLGQWMGLHKMTQVLIEWAPRVGVNPVAVGRGFAESLRTSILGAAVLLFAVSAWFILHARWRRITERRQPPASTPGPRQS